MHNLYIGSNNDIYPLLYYPNTNWIYIDSLPNSDGYLKEYADEHYINETIKLFNDYSYTLTTHNFEEKLIVFTNNNNNTIHFFYNTIFPNDLSSLQISMINNSSILYISAFIPDISILKMCKINDLPLEIIVSNNTYVYYSKYNENNENNENNNDLFGYILINNIPNIKLTFVHAKMSYDFSNKEIILREVAESKKYHCKNVYELYQIVGKSYYDSNKDIDYLSLFNDIINKNKSNN
jgi:hypothetical protein